MGNERFANIESVFEVYFRQTTKNERDKSNNNSKYLGIFKLDRIYPKIKKLIIKIKGFDRNRKNLGLFKTLSIF